MDKIRNNIILEKSIVEFNIEKSIKGTLAYEINEDIQKGLSTDDIIEKAKAGVYKNTIENRKKGIVGQKYGNTKKEEPTFYEGSTKEDFDKFRNCLSNLPESSKAFITDYSSKEYIKKGAKCYLSSNGKSGFVVTGDKDIISVFSLPGERMGEYALFNAVKNGGRTLDCIHPKLVEIYNKYGFKEESRIKWDDQYAPPNWDYDKNGRPDVVFMKFNK